MDRAYGESISISTEKEVSLQRDTMITRFILKDTKEKEKTSVYITYKNKEEYILCTLIPEVKESAETRILLRAGERFSLRTNRNTVSMHIEEGEQTEYEASESPISLSGVRIRGNERVILSGCVSYSLANLVSSSTRRVSLCMSMEDKEVTLGNFIQGRIESIELSLELSERQEVELFLVGDGEVDIIGHIEVPTQEPHPESSEEYTECSNESVECKKERRVSFNLPEDEMLPEDQEDFLFNETTKENLQNKRKSGIRAKEDRKNAQREKDKQEIKVVEVRKGSGRAEVRRNDKVKIRYSVFVKDKLAEKSSSKGVIFTMGTGQMIRGLELGIEGMKVGEKRCLTIPPHLAYGEARVGNIPPNTPVVFRVELCDIFKR